MLLTSVKAPGPFVIYRRHAAALNQGKNPSQLGCDFYSAQTPLSPSQYRQNAFVDSHLSESMASVQSHGRKQGFQRTD